MPTTEIGNYVKKRIVKNANKMETETLKPLCTCSNAHHDMHESKTKIVF